MSDTHPKIASPDHAIEPLFARRFSPYAYEPKAVEADKLVRCLEAARWSASSYNEQPWIFIVATRDDEAGFAKALSCLVEANQAWAKHAGALIITATAKAFTRNGKPNRVAEHDLGAAATSLALQAAAEGLQAHQMAGVNLTQARQAYNIPDSHDPVTAIAIGYAADPDSAPDADLADRDKGARSRKPLADFVFGDDWGKTSSVVG